MTPEVTRRAFMGGKKYGPEAYAEKVARGEISPDEIRRIIGVDPDGNPIYTQYTQEEPPYMSLPYSWQGPNSKKTPPTTPL
ncbi:MAG: hypothetical protein ACK4FL_01525 [Microgenomates group bacterium]